MIIHVTSKTNYDFECNMAIRNKNFATFILEDGSQLVDYVDNFDIYHLEGGEWDIEEDDPNPIPVYTNPIYAQITAVTDRQDFMEECIAEIAAQVYNV